MTSGQLVASKPFFMRDGSAFTIDMVIGSHVSTVASLVGCVIFCGCGCADIQNIRVFLTAQNFFGAAVTDRAGFFRFAGFKPGSYRLFVPEFYARQTVALRSGENYKRIYLYAL